jgi:hypothetical protein
MATTERLARLLAACVRAPLDRREGRGPARLPRTPAQAAAAGRRDG